jgi:hypothetical protein
MAVEPKLTNAISERYGNIRVFRLHTLLPPASAGVNKSFAAVRAFGPDSESHRGLSKGGAATAAVTSDSVKKEKIIANLAPFAFVTYIGLLPDGQSSARRPR